MGVSDNEADADGGFLPPEHFASDVSRPPDFGTRLSVVYEVQRGRFGEQNFVVEAYFTWNASHVGTDGNIEEAITNNKFVAVASCQGQKA